MRPRFSLARRKAAELLREARVRTAPVPVEAMAVLAGAVIRYEPFPGQLSGMVHRQRDGRAVIGVNSLHPVTRRRFTIAHELGHLLLHEDEKFHVDEKSTIAFRNQESSQATSSDEIEANQFAAELLMPSEIIAKEIKMLPEDIET